MTNLYRGTQKIQKRLAKPLVARLKWSKKWSKWSTNGVKKKKKKHREFDYRAEITREIFISNFPLTSILQKRKCQF